MLPQATINMLETNVNSLSKEREEPNGNLRTENYNN